MGRTQAAHGARRRCRPSGIAPIELEARKAGPGHYVIGGAPLAPAGDWTLEVVARVSEFDEHRARFDVPVR